MMVELQKLLEIVVEKNASDLHITAGAPPRFRIHGKLVSFVEGRVVCRRRALCSMQIFT